MEASFSYFGRWKNVGDLVYGEAFPWFECRHIFSLLIRLFLGVYICVCIGEKERRRKKQREKDTHKHTERLKMSIYRV